MAVNSPDAFDIVIGRQDWRRRIVQDYEPVAGRLLQAYERVVPRLQQAAGEFDTQLRLLAQDGARITAQEVRDLSTYQRLLLRVESEMTDFSALLKNEAAGLSDRAIQLGTDAALDMASNSAGRLAPLIEGAWNRPDPGALQRLIGYVDSDAMQSRFAAFGENAAANLGDVILASVAQGKGARAIASMMSGWYGVPLAWANNTARTVQIYSYRTSNHATYAANGDILSGWMWSASIGDPRTCLSCISQHGKVFPLSQTLNDHFSGRCSPIPLVRGVTWPNSVQTGVEWFESQPESVQQAQMGQEMWNAWNAGEVAWEDFSRPMQHDVFGEMWVTASLKSLRKR